jgi:nucleoid-associated protein EbfC
MNMMRGGGGMGNMQKMMKQMQKMQKDMAKAQEELGEQRIEGTAGGGMVTVTVSGHKEVVDVKINEEAVDPEDVEMLQDLVLAATNDALKKAEELTNETMGQFTKGMNLPGMF